MTTKIIQWSRPNKAGLYPLALRVTINRRKRYYFLPIATTTDNWDAAAERLRSGPKEDRTLVEAVKARAKNTMYELMLANTPPSFDMFDPFGAFNDKAPLLHEYMVVVMDYKKNEDGISPSTYNAYKYANTRQTKPCKPSTSKDSLPGSHETESTTTAAETL